LHSDHTCKVQSTRCPVEAKGSLLRTVVNYSITSLVFNYTLTL
jgi:hypothetical protein